MKEVFLNAQNWSRTNLKKCDSSQLMSEDPRNDDAIAQHKTTAHYKGWADFKAAGGVEKQEVMKLESAARCKMCWSWSHRKYFM